MSGNLRIEVIARPGWPVQAWLAVCERDRVVVYHGRDVETADDWFCEAAWAGEFADGDFDRVEIVTGTGGRLRGDRITFVSSASTVDRLHTLERDGRVLVSNSLACLLQACGGSLRPSFASYNRLMSGIQSGLRRYRRALPTSVGEMDLVYFDNLAWDGRQLRREARPDAGVDFADFSGYAGFLQGSLERLARNAAAAERRKVFSLLGSMSSGYDSPTVAVLAARAGCREVITFDRAQGGEDDSGAEIAAALGLALATVPREAWRSRADMPEIPVAAGGVLTSVIFAGAQEQLGGRVLMTGYHGDKIWGLEEHVGPDIVRGDCSGLGLTEYRLWVGFLHCPLPFWGARRAAQIQAISRLPEMGRYRIPGTDYNRPICRRIVEEAGVPREAFGRSKKAADLHLWRESEFLTPGAYRDYLDWLRDHRGDWYRHLRLPPWRSIQGDIRLNALNARATAGVRRAACRLRDGFHRVPPLKALDLHGLTHLNPKLLNLRQYIFPWAVDRAQARYAVEPVDLGRLPSRSVGPTELYAGGAR